MHIKDFITQFAKYLEEMAREEYLTGAGLKSKCETDAISERYEHLLVRRHYEEILKRARRARNPEQKERFERLSWHLMDSIVIAEYSTDDYETAEINATAVMEGVRYPFQALCSGLETHPDATMRAKFAKAYLRVIDRKLNPLLKEQTEGQITAYNRFTTYMNTWDYVSHLKQIDFDLLRRRLLWLMEETETHYITRMDSHCQKVLGRPFDGLNAEESITYVACPMLHRDKFPKERMVEVCAKTFAGMGLHFAEMPNLHLDTEDRPKKDQRAFCIPIRVPEEVRLVIRPNDGFAAYKTFLHEGGHAWHFACTDPKLPYEFRTLPRSDALTETYAFLTEQISQDPRWLCDIAGLTAKQADELADACDIGNMLLFRRYVGKLCYELEHATHPTDHEWNKRRYAAILTQATGFRYEETRFLHDMDGMIGSVDYLLAWINEAHLRKYLIGNFGEDWWRKKETGDFLRELWKEGDGIGVKELAEKIGADHLDTSPLKDTLLLQR